MIAIIFLLLAIGSGAIAWLFYRSVNGTLRRMMILYFACDTISHLIRMGEVLTIKVVEPYMIGIALLPMTIAMIVLGIYLYKTFK